MPQLPLIDTFGRVHRNLRISVTDRCNLRCFYCMPVENVSYLPRPELLSYEEMTRFATLMVHDCGVDKIRITGGEPLVRQSVSTLIQQLLEIPGLHDVSLTTNGILLTKYAQELYEAGLRRINVSLDTLDPVRFQEIARRNSLSEVLDGLQKAIDVGFSPIKLNAVAIKNITEADLVPLAELARETGIEVRFIEYMPLDAERGWERDKVLREETMLEILSEQIGPLRKIQRGDQASPALSYEFADGRGRIGFISSVSQPFCENCNRFRLTADGKLRNCLFSMDETDIRTLLRENADDRSILEAVAASIRGKWEGHEINTARFLQPDRPMHSIGG